MHEFYKKVKKPDEKVTQEDLEFQAKEADVRAIEETESHTAEIIDECRRLFRTPLLEADRAACRVALTKELKEFYERRDEVLLKILKEQNLLMDGGEIFWAHVVEANKLLFNPTNEHTLPAAIVYSTDRFYDDKVGHLDKLAKGLGSMKASSLGDDEIGQFVKTINDHFEGILRLQLPGNICENRPVYYATILVQPHHLPNQSISKMWFPVIANFNATEAVTVLPSHYWPQRLVAYWEQHNTAG